MNAITAAIYVLQSLREIHANAAESMRHPTSVGVCANLFERAIDRAARSSAFRLLHKKGLTEWRAGGTGAKLWRLSAKGLAVRDGEELSAVS